MTSALFFDWLRRFDKYVQQKKDRKVALILDNCSAHGTMEKLPYFANVTVIFLPPNSTSKVQPMDAGIIAAMKVKYRRYQMERALDLAEEDVLNIYKVDILSAMRAFKRIWRSLPPSLIRNCWKHTGILPNRAPEWNRMEIRTLVGEDIDAIQEHVTNFSAPRQRNRLEMILNPEGEDEHIIQHVSDIQLVSNIMEYGAEGSSSEESEDEEVVPLCTKEVLRSVAVVKRFFESEECPDRNLLRGLRSCQGRLRTQRSQQNHQTRIDDFF